MTDKQLIEKLEQNMIAYHSNSIVEKELEAKQNILKKENLAILQELNIKSHNSSNLRIEIRQAKKKIGVDENKLIALIGQEHVDPLKRVPIEAVMAGIKDGTIYKNAIDCILTIDQAPYTIIKSLEEKSESVNVAD